ncbi:tail terminator [Microbacterium phage Sippinontea]|uniref:Tail terminator n=1 Tax=Microbacterium phage Quaker TaxID=2250352 RepID=A0A2Z5H8R8_9CAUD|nr:minor tail protein [Microbacterium phage Quaker]AXC35365.1 tail terminator [Microbacterium phage KayPaulus]QDF18034.1 tail terminator [Microbacterium phage Belthelas]QKY78773.1 tail terminator [Microbacterium phage Livingwater]QOI67283.1 tail terminator [Microbacterium phage Sippinontea]QRI45127.1 tail terminator [Microbacterium phage Wolfpack]QWS68289.1 tail terminator [Microbacterium phage Concrete]QXN74890.1 tail terminator [Microbacterium phage BoomRoasted]QYC54901.1 tail terminator 
MSVLGDLRRELADDVAGSPVELTTYDHVPARVQLPAAFVMAGAPYVEADQTFGSSIVRFGVVLLTQPSMNADETDQLDERIETVQRRLLSAGWLVERIERPEIQDLNGAEVLATALSVAAGGVTFP